MEPNLQEPEYPSEEGVVTTSGKDKNYFSDVFKLVTGSGFVQAFRALISPVLSRLFLPEYFGILQNFLSISKPLGIVSSLRYDRAILLPKERKVAANMLVASLVITLIFSTVLVGLVALFGDNIATALNSPDLAHYLWFAPLFVAALGIFEALRQWNSRERKYMRLSIAQVISEVTGEGLMAGFGFAGFTSGSIMIIMQLVGQIFATVSFSWLVFREDINYILGSLDWSIIKENLAKYKKLPLFNLWGNLISNAALYIPSILLSMYFSPTVAGYYALGNNAIRLPISVVGNSIGQVFYQRCAKAYYEGGVKPIVEGTLKHLVMLSLFPMLLISIIGQELFVVVFGAKWLDAGSYSQILSLWVFFVFITVPVSYIPSIYDKNEKFLIFQILNLATRVGSLVYGGLKGDVWLALWLFTISGIIVYAGMLFWITSIVGMKFKQTMNYLFRGILVSAPFLLAILLFKLWNPIPHTLLSSLNMYVDHIGLLLFSCIVALIYFFIYMKKDQSIQDEIGNLKGAIKKKKS